MKPILFVIIFALCSTAVCATAIFEESVIVDERIDEGLVAVGREIKITEPVYGDVYAAGEDISITAPVYGDVVIAGKDIYLSSNITGNATLFGESIIIEGNINGLAATGKDIKILGTASNIDVSGEKITILGEVNDARIKGAYINIVGTVKGDLEYLGDIEKTGTIHGEISEPAGGFEFVGWIASYLLFFGIGCIVIAAAPKYVRKRIKILKKRPLAAMLVGLVFIIFVPIMLFIMILTIIGIPIALIGFLFYIAFLYVSKFFVSYLVGEELIKTNRFLAFAFGLLIVNLVIMIPMFGGVIWFLVIITGAGIILLPK